MGGGEGTGGWATGLGRAFADALWPVQCPGCGRWDTALCPGCHALASPARPPGWEVLDGEDADLPLWALGDYGGALRRLVLAAKHRPRVDLTAFLEEAGRSLGGALAASGLVVGDPVWVVPAPSGWRRRHAGQMVATHVAAGVGRALAQGGGGGAAADPGPRRWGEVRVVDALRLRTGAGTQSARSAEQRRSGRAGAMRMLVEPPPGAALVLVDDVVTTGATVREAARVLGEGTSAVACLCRVGWGGEGRTGS